MQEEDFLSMLGFAEVSTRSGSRIDNNTERERVAQTRDEFEKLNFVTHFESHNTVKV